MIIRGFPSHARRRVERAKGLVEQKQFDRAAALLEPLVAQKLPVEQDLDEPTFLKRLDAELPGLGKQHRKLLIDAAAVAAYHAETGYPVVRALICDDAPQFNWLTQQMMQCWVHEGRHYKTLAPVFPWHQKQLQAFLTRFWGYYDQLLTYCNDPTPAEDEQLFPAPEKDAGYSALQEQYIQKVVPSVAALLPSFPAALIPAGLRSTLAVPATSGVEAVSRLTAIFALRGRALTPGLVVDRGADTPDKSWFNVNRRNARWHGLDGIQA